MLRFGPHCPNCHAPGSVLSRKAHCPVPTPIPPIVPPPLLVFKINTLFTSEEKVSANVLAHEIAHCIVDHYFSVIPPTKVAEMIAQYADAHIRD